MIADWKLELMGKKVLEQVFGEKLELIDRTIDLIRRCFRTAQPKESCFTNLTARMERIKAKKNTLLEMRTEGEITKEEFLEHRQKLDEELTRLTAEYEGLIPAGSTPTDMTNAPVPGNRGVFPHYL